jgi:hypothetical protein
MSYRVRRAWLFGIVMIVLLGGQTPAASQRANPQDGAVRAVRSFYAFHIARNKDFNTRNIRLRKRWLTPELYNALLAELKREAQESKAHPDEAPYFEGDPLTDSQEYPDSFRVGKAEVDGDLAKVTVTMLWSARTSRGRDKRDIVVEVAKSATGWLINDIISSDGSRLSAQLKRER